MRRFLLLPTLCLYLALEAAIGPQMEDFLCGCEYCQTVDKGEPLDIASHMIKCHSWRKGMEKTLELMNRTAKPEVKIEEKDRKKISTKNQQDNKVLNKKYSWKESEEYGWIYHAEKQTINILNTWIYSEHLGWVWPFAKFIYSDKYGWIYNVKYKSKRIMYWYDRRMWLLPKAFSKIRI
jgi:hypothetical protein